MPIIKTPIGIVDPATIEKLRSSLDPSYGNTMIEQECEKILVIRTPVPDPDPVNDLERGVAQLDNFDIKVDRIILLGTEQSISIDGTTASIVLERMKKNPLRNKYKMAKSEYCPPAPSAAKTPEPVLRKDSAFRQEDELIRQNIQDRSEWHYAPSKPLQPQLDAQNTQAAIEPATAAISDEVLEGALREKGFMIFEISLGQNGPITRNSEGVKTGVIAARKGKYPEKMLLRFYDSCSGYDVEKASTVADALDVNFCLMVYETIDAGAKTQALGKKVELVSRSGLNGFLEMI
ncbi:MAG: hypothetical protein PHH26_02420 [Candidatus Thermoplasmatota archaeon]|nr:hypothetical protein [Candidatus Thermoplasmatota archaeon]